MATADAVKAVLVFLTWTVTSFLCHYFAKAFLRGSVAGAGALVPACLVTSLQAAMCYGLTNIQVPSKGDHSGRSRRLFLVKASTHVLATLATNYSLACMQAASTMAVKLLEPLTSALVQWLVLGVPLSLAGRLSLPLVVVGAVLFVGGPAGGGGGAAVGGSSSSSQALGAGLALASNLLLAARNLAVKLEQDPHSDSSHGSSGRLRRPNVIVLTILVTLSAVTGIHVFLGEGRPALFLAGSSVFHVVYSHVSTGVVLRYLSVVSHAVANIFKRVLVVLLLYAAGQRSATPWNFLGLAISTSGLLLYAIDKVKVAKRKEVDKTASTAGGRLKWMSGITLASVVALLPLSLLSQSLTSHGQYWDVWSPSRGEENMMGASFRSGFGSEVPMETRAHLANYAGPLTSREVQAALEADLVKDPLMADAISPGLNSSADITVEAQRLHFKVFSQLLSGYKYAFLMDLAAFENKGDPAISLGEVYLLRRLGIKILYYCNFYACKERNLDFAKNLSRRFSHHELVILIHGGGNLVGYSANDRLREKVFKRFDNFQMIIFPQSIYMKDNSTKHLKYCEKLYQNQGNLTMILRDRHSYALAQKHFSGMPRFLMLPDMAFEIGMVSRFFSPVVDILWLRRSDPESPGYKVPNLPKGVTVEVRDWWKWLTPRGSNSMDTAAVMATNGFLFLQRGRVVISDRLHGHILCTLLNIPHVLIDNKYRKLTNYHHTWTRSSDITVVARDAADAVVKALDLLRHFKDTLPPIAVYMDATEEAPRPPPKATTKSKLGSKQNSRVLRKAAVKTVTRRAVENAKDKLQNSKPTPAPTAKPQAAPTAKPTSAPKAQPTSAPKAQPTSAPKAQPTSAPKAQPTSAPKAQPTSAPKAQAMTAKAPQSPTKEQQQETSTVAV